jgi:addiction module RelE/StbE family toxin
MPLYDIKITRHAVKDIKHLSPKLKNKLKNIITELISENPYIGKALVGELKGNYSYRLTLKDRIIYSVDENKKIVYIKRARTHYGD